MQHRPPPPRTRQILYLHILDTLQLVWGTAVQFCSQKIVFVHVFGAFLAVVIAVGYLSFYASQYMRHLFKVGWLFLLFIVNCCCYCVMAELEPWWMSVVCGHASVMIESSIIFLESQLHWGVLPNFRFQIWGKGLRFLLFDDITFALDHFCSFDS